MSTSSLTFRVTAHPAPRSKRGVVLGYAQLRGFKVLDLQAFVARVTPHGVAADEVFCLLGLCLVHRGFRRQRSGWSHW